jgi:transcriptional regulator with XRE-family HTH domain
MAARNDENKTEVSQRIAKIKTYFCNNNNGEFARKLGVTEQYASNISNGTKSTGAKLLDKILETFPQVSKQWLYLGEGEMLSTSTPAVTQHIDLSADDTIANLNDYISLLKEKVARLENELRAEREKVASLSAQMKMETISL